ncbi:MAG: PAS domain S-box protein, partial [Candidatus Cloacimonetes bacterium]|nr:PAS domain S-box protein [Candidatus Cloacimonadota bacterium]
MMQSMFSGLVSPVLQNVYIPVSAHADKSIFVGLIYNAALLLALGIIFDSVTLKRYRNTWIAKILTGLSLAAVVIAIMINPWVSEPGVVFDTRSILLSVTAMFFGAIPTAIAVIFAIALRIWQGGGGTLMGCSVITASVACGYIWKKIHHRWKNPYGIAELYSLGIVTHIAMLLLTLLLPESIRLDIFRSIFFPVIIIYPIVTVFLGQVIARRIKRRQEKFDLELREKQFRALYEEAPMPYQSLDLAGNIIAVNQTWLQTLGYQREEVIGHNFKEFLHSDSHELFDKIFPILKASRNVEDVGYQYLKKDGSTILATHTSRVVSDEEGRIKQTQCIFVDITERRQTEKNLEAANAELIEIKKDWENIFQSIPHATYILDKDQTVLTANIATEKALGLSKEQMLGRKCWELMHGENCKEPPPGCPFSKSCESTTSQTGEMEVQALGGWFMVTCKPIFSQDGSIEKVIHIAMDITDMKKTELALQEFHSMFEQFMKYIPGGVFISDKNSKALYVNQHIIDVFGEFGGVGSSPLDVFPREIGEALIEEDKLALQEGFRQTEETVPHKDGTFHVYEATKFAIKRENEDDLLGGILLDITNRKTAEIALRESQTRFEQFMNQIPGNAFIKDINSRLLYVNKHMVRAFGADSWIGKTPHDIFGKDVAEEILEDDLLVLAVKSKRMRDALNDEKGITRHYETTKFTIDLSESEVLIGGLSLDITDRVQAEEEVQNYMRRLEILHEIDSIILESMSLATVGEKVLTLLNKLVRCSIITLNEIEGLASTISAAYVSSDKFPLIETGKTYHVTPEFRDSLLEEKIVLINDASQLLPNSTTPIRTKLIEAGARSFLYISLFVQGELLGFLALVDEAPNFFQNQNLREITEVAKQFSIAIHQLKLIREIKQHGLDMEKRVEERTEQLKYANQQLEEFSYTVAHDLRSPLRLIDGFSSILMDDHANHLSPEATELLKTVRLNTQKMDTLIKELLELAKLNPYSLKYSTVNMEKLVAETLQLVLKPDISAQFEINIGDLPDVFADGTLIRQLWINLIGNAVKFTMPQANKRISIGSLKRGVEVIYFVQDSGVGFDVMYVEKIFNPFQRLHKDTEFEG